MADFSIKKIKAREILDSRDNPTVEVDVLTASGLARASVPSGASTGRHEAVELRDGGKRYGGKGVLKAVGNVNGLIAKGLRGRDVRLQGEIDEYLIELDGTENKSKLGANALLGVSIAVCRAAAMSKKMPLFRYIASLTGNKKLRLPTPSLNIINGGAHAENTLDIQEFMIQPLGSTFAESMKMGTETYQTLRNIIKKTYGKNAVNVGDEGGFAAPLKKADEALQLLTKAIDDAGYQDRIVLALDAAASQFYKNGTYRIEGKKYDTEAMIKFYTDLAAEYPIVSIEDPFHEEDWHGFAALTERMGKKVKIIGDDLLVTNIKRISKAVEMEACNGLLLKPNQIGTVTESIHAGKFAMENKWSVMVSHRSGETSDSFIADLAVGLGAGFIKAGAPCRSERLAKYNQLIRIEEEMQAK